ncbi:lipopolysaccharide assembly protein LapB [Pseudidiomarina sp. CB1]|uniref:tetratricopeptide repeat protein n=1 Tax=Pseudidiomarina sp. CB1 TaxID=2972484 RepID=UPI0021620A3D|nr:tetratricopeptide repeat protein [Pseudidiomarina sp. CB1]
MSVINRMLRDLDKRQQQDRQTVSTPAAAAPKPFPWGWVLGAIVIIAIAVTAVMVIWQTTTSQPEPVEVTTTTAPSNEPATTSTPATSKATQPQQEPAAIVTEPTAAAVPVAAATQPQQRLQPEPIAQTSASDNESQVAQTAQEQVVATPEQPPVADEKPQGTMQVERVELSAEELAEVKLKQAREAMQKGERQRAGSLFEQVIALAPEHVAARSELAAYWYGRGQISSALAVLEQGLELQPQQSRWQLLYAKILLEGGAYQRVVDALRQINPNAAEAADLYQLRAAAANEVGRYASAAADYVVLAERTGEGRWWLAAAVAFEDAQQPDAAMRSYQQALATDTLNADARNYAQQRLNTLGDR